MQKADILKRDTVKKQHEIGVIRQTIRGFDRLQDDYIEPQHYEFTIMGQITRTYENFILSSNGQSIRLAPDGRTKVGPYFGWRAAGTDWVTTGIGRSLTTKYGPESGTAPASALESVA